jgi:hypothetical protein
LFVHATTAGKKQIPHGLKAVRDDNSEIVKPDITYAALNKAPGHDGQLRCELKGRLPEYLGNFTRPFAVRQQATCKNESSLRENFMPRRQSCRSLLQRLDDGIVHKGPDLADGLRHAVGPGAVGQQRHRKLARRIDPQRGAGKSEMPKRRGRKVGARRGRRRRSVPSQRSRRTGRRIDSTRE